MVLAADLFYRVLEIDIEYRVFSNDPISLKTSYFSLHSCV